MSSFAHIFDLQALLQPISERNPGGSNVMHDLIMDELREARREDDTLQKGDWVHEVKRADWQKVIALAGEALRHKSKDLQIAAYLAEALLQQHGFTGLGAGLHLIGALLERYWDTLYPEIEDGDLEYRVSRLEWLNANLPFRLKQVPLAAASKYGLLDGARAKRFEKLAASKNELQQKEYSRLREEEKKHPEQLKKAVLDTPREFYEKIAEEIAHCQQELERLGAVVNGKLGQNAPGFHPIRLALEECSLFVGETLKSKPQLKPAETPAAPPEPIVEKRHSEASEQVSSQPVVASANNSASAAAANDQAVSQTQSEPAVFIPQTSAEALAQILRVTQCLRELEPYNPVSYLIVRAVRWGEVFGREGELSPKDFIAPASETRVKLKKLFDEQDWNALLVQAEQASAQEVGAGWLDVQHYVLCAMSHLGQTYSAAGRAVRAALQTYLTDYSHLPKMDLHDGTPAANSVTKNWLEKEIFGRKPLGAAPEEAPVSPIVVKEEAPDIWSQALAKLQSGQLPEALSLLRLELQRAQSPREKFLCKLQMAELCLHGKRPDVSRPLLEELSFCMEEFKLERWEAKELNIRFWRAVYRCFHDLGGKREADRQRLKLAFDKLCQLDVEQAFELSTGE